VDGSGTFDLGVGWWGVRFHRRLLQMESGREIGSTASRDLLVVAVAVGA
jgi:hypothetical protein